MSELKPCPYCGGEGVIGCSYCDIFDRYCDWFVECAECGATNINPTKGYSTKEEVIKAWNTRAESKDYLKEVHDWAYSNMECCDEPEWSLFTGIVGAISKYRREISKCNNIPDDYYDIEF